MRTMFLFSIAVAAILALFCGWCAFRSVREGFPLVAIVLVAVGLVMIVLAVNLVLYTWREWNKALDKDALRPLADERTTTGPGPWYAPSKPLGPRPIGGGTGRRA